MKKESFHKTIQSVIKILLLSLVVIQESFSAPAKVKTLTFSTSSHPAVSNYYELLVVKAYERLGIKIELLHINEERSLRLLETGQLDGDIIRTEAVLRNFQSFIPVYMMGDANVYLICQQGVKCNESVLKRRSWILGSVAGSTYFEEFLDGAKIGLLKYTEYPLLKESYTKKRIDAYIDVISTHYPTTELPEDAGTYHLGTIYGYHILHKKHSHLAYEVSEILRELQNNTPTISSMRAQSASPKSKSEATKSEEE